MPTKAVACAHREDIDAWIAGQLHGDAKSRTELHLQRCETCRTAFRQETAGRFPRIRNYTLLEEVGRGGFGVVYKAIHHGKERVEALKVLFGTSAAREAYFTNEVHVVAQLNHPNIATLYEAHLSGDPHYYAMEFVDGRTIDEYLQAGPVSLEERIRLVQAVASAVEYAHRRGVVHRDLKPQNILIDAAGQPRILDFGIAKRLPVSGDDTDLHDPDRQKPEGAMGTYGYMPPEQVAGDGVDERSDIFSLGALLFHVITGQPARLAPQREWLRELLRGRQVNRADDLAAIISRCVDPTPERRYESCAALVADLDRYLSGRPVAARPDVTTGYRVARIAGVVLRHYPLAVQVAAVVLVACLLTPAVALVAPRVLIAPPDPRGVALVAVTPETIAAIRRGELGADLPGFSAVNRKSWRVLYGQLMQRLAEGKPRAVVWDYYFPDARPAYDEAFVAGVKALDAPVIVGVAHFDDNGEPQLSPAMRDAVHGWGTLQTKSPGYLNTEILAPLAIERGNNPAVPSLALAAFAAARYPDCDVAIQTAPRQLELRYRKRKLERGDRRWPSSDTVDVFEVEKVGERHEFSKPAEAFELGDALYLARYSLEGMLDWPDRAVPFEKVMAADAAQLGTWFAGRVVLIGEMAGRDQHALRSGEMIHGCQMHAQALESLLAHAEIHRVWRPELTMRIAGWCLAALLLANLLPVRAVRFARRRAALAAGLVVIGLAAGIFLSMRVTDAWMLHAALAGSTLVAAGSACLAIRMLRERELQLTPALAWSAGDTTISTAKLATASDSPAATR